MMSHFHFLYFVQLLRQKPPQNRRNRKKIEEKLKKSRYKLMKRDDVVTFVTISIVKREIYLLNRKVV